jgi:hypothetical protein
LVEKTRKIFSVKDCLKNRHERAALSTAKDVNRNDIKNTAIMEIAIEMAKIL